MKQNVELTSKPSEIAPSNATTVSFQKILTARIERGRGSAELTVNTYGLLLEGGGKRERRNDGSSLRRGSVSDMDGSS